MSDRRSVRQRLRAVSPWTLVALAGCAALSLVDLWRGAGPTDWPVVRGSLPNLVAVPTLAFGFLMLRFPERRPLAPEARAQQARWFWRLWAGAIAVTVAWEFSQMRGALVFDPLDLAATGVGTALAAGLFVGLRERAFVAPEATRSEILASGSRTVS